MQYSVSEFLHEDTRSELKKRVQCDDTNETSNVYRERKHLQSDIEEAYEKY